MVLPDVSATNLGTVSVKAQRSEEKTSVVGTMFSCWVQLANQGSHGYKTMTLDWMSLDLPPWLVMCLVAGTLFLGCKSLTWRRLAGRGVSWRRTLAWPGMGSSFSGCWPASTACK